LVKILGSGTFRI